jgi:hypothetical protein
MLFVVLGSLPHRLSRLAAAICRAFQVIKVAPLRYALAP